MRRILWAFVLAILALALPVAARSSRTPASPRSAPATRQPATQVDKELSERQQKARRIAEINRRLFRLFQEGKYAECESLLAEILRIDPANSVAWYNMACVHSRLGRLDKAVQCLNTAVGHGYSDFRHMERDGDLDAVRQTPGYQRLIARKDEIQRQRAEKIRDQLRQRFGAGYICGIDHDRKLVFATNVDRQTLEEMKERLTAYASAQWKDLFTHPFEQYLTVVIPKEGDWQYGPMLGGFYAREANTLYARTLGMTLMHEFTHALHASDQDGAGQRHPIWITEGFATLFESARVTDGHAFPEPNQRLNMLQAYLRRRMTIPFDEFVRIDQGGFMAKAPVAYAQCRYMMMYLYDKGLLKKWYDAYVEGFERDPAGAEALEGVFGKPLAGIEADWKKWAAGLKAPIVALPPDHAYLGIRLQAAVDGVQVVEVVPGSGADKAGLRPGDVIVRIDDERIIDPSELMDLIEGRQVGDKVTVRYRRDGRYLQTAVTLGRMPGRAGSRTAPRTSPATAAATRVAPATASKAPPRAPATQPATQPATTRSAPPATRKAA